MIDPNNCLNCDAPLHGEFCSRCGQSSRGVKDFFLTLVNEAFEDVFSRNSRVWKTFIYLLFMPGLLSKEYCKGRRVSYVRPVKLYLFTSIFFFLTLALLNFYSEVSTFTAENAISVEQLVQDIEGETGTNFDSGNEDSSYSGSIASLLLKSEFDFVNRIGLKYESASQAVANDSSLLMSSGFDFAPPVVFCLLPLFALFLKLNYLRTGVYYTEHLVLALHNYSFLSCIGTLILLISIVLRNLPSILNPFLIIVALWIPIYIWLSMKVFYQQSVILTSFKYLVLGACFMALVLFGLTLFFFLGLITM